MTSFDEGIFIFFIHPVKMKSIQNYDLPVQVFLLWPILVQTQTVRVKLYVEMVLQF